MNKKSYTHLSFEEREALSLGVTQSQSLRTMATVLGRTPSTLIREQARYASPRWPYRACTAQALATGRTRVARRPRKLRDPWLWRYVQTQLLHGHSPEQIAGRLQRILSICRNASRLRRFKWDGTYYPVAPCALNYWLASVARNGSARADPQHDTVGRTSRRSRHSHRPGALGR